MRAKQFVILVAVAAVLAGAAVFAWRLKNLKGPGGMGAPLYSNLDVNRLTTLSFKGPDGEVDVKLEGGAWKVVQKDGYPASFDKIAEFGRKVLDLKVGRTFTPGEGSTGRMRVKWPEKGAPPLEIGTEVAFVDAGGKDIARFLLGAQRKKGDGPGIPDGHYIVKKGETQVSLVNSFFDENVGKASYWLKPDIVKVESASVRRLVCMAGEKGAWKTRFAFKRPGEGKSFEKETFPEGKEVNWSSVDRVAGAMALLELDDVEKYDPQTGGVDDLYLEYELFNGSVYRLYKGKPEADGKCRIRLAAEFRPGEGGAQAVIVEEELGQAKGGAKDLTTAQAAPGDVATAKAGPGKTSPAEEAEKKLKEQAELAARLEKENTAFAPWVFTIAKWRADALYTAVEDMEQKKEAAGVESGGGMPGMPGAEGMMDAAGDGAGAAGAP
jgi:hypothetical protein